ncbi:MAG: histidinol-phosphate transaminase [Spirochaetota bacterium]
MKTRAVLAKLDPYVPGKRIEGGIKLSSNENALGPAPRAREAIESLIHDVHRYPDGGMHDLRAALAKRWTVDADMVVAGNGSDEILMMIGAAFIEPGTNAVTAAHTFSQYTFATQVFGGEIRLATMQNGRFDPDAVLDQIDGHTRVVFLCNPNNPTGTIIPKAALEDLLARVPRDVLVVIDEAYGEYVDSDDYPDTLALLPEHPNLIRLRTFSKIYGLAAMRVGYGIARAELIESIMRVRPPFNVGTLSQAAATAALEDTEFVERSLENNRLEKARLCAFLDAHDIRYFPTEANFLCADFSVTPGLPGIASAGHAVRELDRRRIAVRPLVSFGLPDHLRISIGTADEMDALYAALEEIGRASER